MKVSKEDFDNLLGTAGYGSIYTDYGTILLEKNGANLNEEEFGSQEEAVKYLYERKCFIPLIGEIVPSKEVLFNLTREFTKKGKPEEARAAATYGFLV